MFTLVIPTLNATSPRERYVITLLDVPPGHVPTSTTPAINAVSRPKTMLNPHANNGIIVNCATVPRRTYFGCVKTGMKSLMLRVRPIPNITSINSGLIQLVWIHSDDDGTNNDNSVTATTITAM